MQLRPTSGRIIDPEFLLTAYVNGYFPMADPKNGEIGWHSPDPRAVIDLDRFKVSRSLRQVIRKARFETRVDTQFEEVMRNCAARDETWISEQIVRSYVELYRRGHAHSVESWREDRLSGGLYGVSIGGAFFGESMFSRERDASKVALVALVDRMKMQGYQLLDTQFITPHLQRFGAREIPRSTYLGMLGRAVRIQCQFVSPTAQ